MPKKLTLAFMLGLFALGSLNACSTAKGFGQDVEDTGEYIEEKSDDATD